MTVTRSIVCALTLAGCLACQACHASGPSPRTLHYVGEDLVATRPVDHRAYAAYLQAELALAMEPPDLRRAHQQILLALDHDRHDAHLWTVRGQIALRLGDRQQAARASERALALRPGYKPAQELAAQLGGGPQFVQRRP